MAHARTHACTATKNYIEILRLLRCTDIKKNSDTTATREDLNFHMDRSFILKRNNRQICHPTEHCVCSLNVRVKIPPTLKKIGL